MGHEVFICTAPLTNYENSVLEKYKWVEKNFGHEWIKKIILTKDKTLIKGDILIDDNPEIFGSVFTLHFIICVEESYSISVMSIEYEVVIPNIS